jgi:hypothetical protein
MKTNEYLAACCKNHMEDEPPETQEFLVRVKVSAQPDGEKNLPDLIGWDKTHAVVDPDMKVRYATYSKLVAQPITGDGPDIDRIADTTSDVEIQLEAILNLKDPEELAYNKRVYLISHPIAVWDK